MKDIFISQEATIKETLQKLDKSAEKVLLVVDEKRKLLGTISDGDIRRYILKTGKIEGNIKYIYNRNPIYVYNSGFSEKLAKNTLIDKKIELLPIVNKDKIVVNFVSWTSVFGKKLEEEIYKKSNLDIPVVIMAGGRGMRLDPFTRILPKPLIPIGEKPVIEYIIDRFRKQGVKKFYITLNYKGEMIEAYFKGIERDYDIEFVWEDDFWGTGGSLKLLEEKIEKNFIVSNCDIMVRADFCNLINFHKRKKAFLTLILSIQHYKIPYGVVKFKDGGEIVEMVEKPEYTFSINTGVYVVHKESLKYIPQKQFFNMSDLVNILLRKNERVVAYPVGESDYLDIGQWEKYKKAMEYIKRYGWK